MKERSSFIASRVIEGKFVALSNKGKLYAWDMITGKLLDNNRASTYKHLKDFELYTWVDEDADKRDTVYAKEWYTKVLLRKKTPMVNFDTSSFQGHGGTDEHIECQVSYNHSIEKQFYEFRVVEIESDC